jgi:hypothetical protein
MNDANLEPPRCPPSAPPWCSTVIFRRFGKRLILKDFCAIAKRWRIELESNSRFFNHSTSTKTEAAEEALACLLQRFEPEPGSIPVGTIVEARRLGPRLLPRRLLFYFAS